MQLSYKEEVISHKVIKYNLSINAKLQSFKDWIALMQSKDDAILKFNKLLKNSKFKAYFWEVKPVITSTLDQAFEFVLVQSNRLPFISANPTDFQDYFSTDEAVVNFNNIRKDAELIVPVPSDSDTDYGHLANFVRTAKPFQIIEFWKRVAEVYNNNIGTQQRWLNTSGLGVHWLHVRVDSRPKYYQFKPYKDHIQ